MAQGLEVAQGFSSCRGEPSCRNPRPRVMEVEKKASRRCKRRVGEKLKERWANHIKLRKFPEPKIIDTEIQS